MPRHAAIFSPRPRPRNHLRQEKPIPVFYFGMGRAVKKRTVVCGGGCVQGAGAGEQQHGCIEAGRG